MLYIVKELPEHVQLSEHLRDMAEFYYCIQSGGISYYIPATPDIRRLIGVNKDGSEHKPDKRRRWDRYRKADALRYIVNALELQVRDVVMAGIEENVKQTLLERMDEAMSPMVRKMVGARAQLQIEEGGKR